ncbi:hypothetical protein PCE1_003551 [Barthelona sp. PCE]
MHRFLFIVAVFCIISVVHARTPANVVVTLPKTFKANITGFNYHINKTFEGFIGYDFNEGKKVLLNPLGNNYTLRRVIRSDLQRYYKIVEGPQNYLTCTWGIYNSTFHRIQLEVGDLIQSTKYNGTYVDIYQREKVNLMYIDHSTSELVRIINKNVDTTYFNRKLDITPEYTLFHVPSDSQCHFTPSAYVEDVLEEQMFS